MDTYTLLLCLGALTFGLLWGSFANVVIARAPLEQSVVRPPSRCPKCGVEIRWFDNIPLVSYALLRGRCRSCGVRIPASYPMVEAACGALALGLWLHISSSVGGYVWDVLPSALLVFVLQLYLVVSLVILAEIDREHMLLPHRVTVPLLIMGLFASWSMPADGVWLVYHPNPGLVASLIGALAGVGSLWLVFVIYHFVTGRAGLGGGDLVLTGAFGAWFGWWALPAVILLASLQGLLVALVLALVGRLSAIQARDGAASIDRDAASAEEAADGASFATAQIAFGPFLVVAALEYLFFGDAILRWMGV